MQQKITITDLEEIFLDPKIFGTDRLNFIEWWNAITSRLMQKINPKAQSQIDKKYLIDQQFKSSSPTKTANLFDITYLNNKTAQHLKTNGHSEIMNVYSIDFNTLYSSLMVKMMDCGIPKLPDDKIISIHSEDEFDKYLAQIFEITNEFQSNYIEFSEVFKTILTMRPEVKKLMKKQYEDGNYIDKHYETLQTQMKIWLNGTYGVLCGNKAEVVLNISLAHELRKITSFLLSGFRLFPEVIKYDTDEIWFENAPKIEALTMLEKVSTLFNLTYMTDLDNVDVVLLQYKKYLVFDNGTLIRSKGIKSTKVKSPVQMI